MFTAINQSQFIDEFRAHGRQDQFSYGALVALFQSLEEMEEQTGEELELDVIGLCCEFAEYADLEAYNADYNDSSDAQTMQDIEDRTTVIYIGKGDSFLIQQY
tara:strand:+ start:1070 stop:1378 length:309 start_codon:yes stop_codon:yes gene_type:complete